MIRLVKAWKIAHETNNALEKAGYKETPYIEIEGVLADAIYYLIGENTSEFHNSVTFKTLRSETLSPDQCADVFLREYEKKYAPALELSAIVKQSLQEAAEQMGIGVESMINVILCEWALQRNVISEHIKSLMNK